MKEDKRKFSNDMEEFSTQENYPYRKDSWLIAKNLSASFKYAAQGLTYTFLSQRNFRIHVFIGIFVSFISLWLNLPFTHLAILALTIGVVLILELLNTSIEAVVDLTIGRRFSTLARTAKDSAAAAVLIASLCSVVIGTLLVLPPLLTRLGI